MQKNIRPYIGFGTGYFHKVIHFMNLGSGTDSGIGIVPSVGILFKTERLSGLYFNTKFSYCKVYTERQLNLLKFDIGICYYFNSKNKKQ